MIRLLRLLFTGDWHMHKWEIEHVNEAILCDLSSGGKPYGGRVTYIQKCAVCGKMRRFRARV